MKARGILSLVLVSFCIASWASAEPAKVEVKKRGPGARELLVQGKPYFIKGVLYNFAVVGDDPNTDTLRDWSILDLDQNGRIDTAYDSWVDKNSNNIQDADEPAVGDWQLLKDLGANTIRIYQMPSADPRISDLYQTPGAHLTFGHPANKAIFRDHYKRYGIMVIVGHFFGEWRIGSGASLDKGTDYSDPLQRQHLLDNVRVMVEEHKDEPYTLMWLIGNENLMPYDNDNAEKDPKAFLTLVNEAAQLIHRLDPNHPVAFCNWFMDHLQDVARYAPDVDIFGMNNYSQGFAAQYNQIRDVYDRPVLLTEFGYPAVGEDDFNFSVQKNYHQVSWRDISENRYGRKGVGNSIGGVVFSWCDQWYLAGSPGTHDRGEKFGVQAVEWFGLTSQGDGRHSPFLRQLKRMYSFYQQLWKDN
jgi:beta-glucuronidase